MRHPQSTNKGAQRQDPRGHAFVVKQLGVAAPAQTPPTFVRNPDGSTRELSEVERRYLKSQTPRNRRRLF